MSEQINITVPDPDDPTSNDMPIYEGPADQAWKSLVPGTYRATAEGDQGGVVAVVPAGPDGQGGVVPAESHFIADIECTVDRAVTVACVSCGEATTSGERARIGDREGRICPDCAHHSDGNLIPSR